MTSSEDDGVGVTSIVGVVVGVAEVDDDDDNEALEDEEEVPETRTAGGSPPTKAEPSSTGSSHSGLAAGTTQLVPQDGVGVMQWCSRGSMYMTDTVVPEY